MSAVEMYYSVAEVSLLMRLHEKTVLLKMHDGEFGDGVVNLGTEAGPDYRIPASGVNAYLERRRIFREPGIAARSIGELRRKAQLAVAPA